MFKLRRNPELKCHRNPGALGFGKTHVMYTHEWKYCTLPGIKKKQVQRVGDGGADRASSDLLMHDSSLVVCVCCHCKKT